ncbi:MAG: hypothetical protein WAV46_01600 [Candidatus Moraniibacteriota bacterium]
MFKISLPSFGELGTKLTLFLFFGLIILSSAFFVLAQDTTSTKNIFQDSDQDGLSNDEEKLYGTDPMKKDTDGDGYSDGIEVESGYDPLRHAPGDKIIKEGKKTGTAPAASQEGAVNLTEQVSGEIATLLKSTDQNGQTISLDDINNSVDKVMSGNVETVILPDIDMKEIKIKSLPKNLNKKKQAEQEKKDAIEYLTVLAYLVANNSPKMFQTESDLGGLLNNLSTESISALASGNTQPLDDLSKKGEKILGELKDIEVPEKMVDVHVKALQMAKYAMQLKGELRPSDTDPLGQIAVLSKAQGFFGSITGLADEVQKKLADYGIEEIPLN